MQDARYYMTFSFRRWFAGFLVDSKLSSTLKKIEKRYATSDEARHMLSAWKLDYWKAEAYRFSQRFPKLNLQLEVSDAISRDSEYIKEWPFQKLKEMLSSRLNKELLKETIATK
jgi:hypothetical protein